MCEGEEEGVRGGNHCAGAVLNVLIGKFFFAVIEVVCRRIPEMA